MTTNDLHFESMKTVTRLSWMLNFEAIATVGNDEDALSWPRERPVLPLRH